MLRFPRQTPPDAAQHASCPRQHTSCAGLFIWTISAMGLPINNLDPDNSDPPLRFGRVALIAKALFASLVLTLLSRGYFTFFDYGMPTHRQDSQPLKGAQLAQTYHAHSASPLPSPLQDNPEGERVWCFFDDSDTSTQSGDSYSHNFTMASSKLYFLNRSQAGGQLAFEAAASASGAKGEVRAHFSVASKKAGCSVNVCLVRNEGGQVGIAIYVSRLVCNRAWELMTLAPSRWQISALQRRQLW